MVVHFDQGGISMDHTLNKTLVYVGTTCLIGYNMIGGSLNLRAITIAFGFDAFDLLVPVAYVFLSKSAYRVVIQPLSTTSFQEIKSGNFFWTEREWCFIFPRKMRIRSLSSTFRDGFGLKLDRTNPSRWN